MDTTQITPFNPAQQHISTAQIHEAAAEAQQALTQTIASAQEPLVTATTVFPFTLFPDTIVIDRTKFTVTHRTFFRAAEVMSIRIEDILNITADVGPLFGSIKIATRFFDTQKPYAVRYFWRNDALRIKRIMQGYIIATQKQIDCSKLSAKQLATMLDELGGSGPHEAV